MTVLAVPPYPRVEARERGVRIEISSVVSYSLSGSLPVSMRNDTDCITIITRHIIRAAGLSWRGPGRPSGVPL